MHCKHKFISKAFVKIICFALVTACQLNVVNQTPSRVWLSAGQTYPIKVRETHDILVIPSSISLFTVINRSEYLMEPKQSGEWVYNYMSSCHPEKFNYWIKAEWMSLLLFVPYRQEKLFPAVNEPYVGVISATGTLQPSPTELFLYGVNQSVSGNITFANKYLGSITINEISIGPHTTGTSPSECPFGDCSGTAFTFSCAQTPSFEVACDNSFIVTVTISSAKQSYGMLKIGFSRPDGGVSYINVPLEGKIFII